MKRTKRFLRAIGESTFFFFIFPISMLISVFLLELYLDSEPVHNPQDRYLRATEVSLDPNKPGRALHDFDLYPFTGGHTQAHFSANFGTFITGPHGFMVDFDIDDPPSKEAGELTVILIGRSAAAGHGATANRHMLHNAMEEVFAESSPCEGKALRVVNLAMGGSRTYQNFISLNIWGHKLAPDLIVSFSGNNDLLMNFYLDFDGYSRAAAFAKLSLSSQDEHIPSLIRNYFPNILHKTSVGYAIRAFWVKDIEQDWMNEYKARFIRKPQAEASVEFFVHGLRSIARDFNRIPIVVAYQPFMASPTNLNDFFIKSNFDVQAHLLIYETFIEKSTALLSRAPERNQFHFLDTHSWYQEKYALTMDPGDGTHMWDTKQRLMAEFLISELSPLLCAL